MSETTVSCNVHRTWNLLKKSIQKYTLFFLYQKISLKPLTDERKLFASLKK